RSHQPMFFKRCRNRILIQAVIVIFLFCCVAMYYCSPALKEFSFYSTSHKTEIINLDALLDQPFYRDNCFDGKLESSLSQLPDNLERWSKAYNRKCQILWRKFHTMFKVNVREGGISFPTTFIKKVRQWLGENDELLKEAYNQKIIEVYNHYNHEQTVFNLLRSKRPTSISNQDPKEYVRKLDEETKESCDFCHYKTSTAEDIFGRIESHSSKHNPLNLSEEEFVDLFNTSVKWFKKANSVDKESCYPMMIYDTLPKGGASQFHPHAHGFLATQYLSHIKIQSDAASAYRDENGSEFWNDFIEIHHALGLTVRFGDAIALSPLTPVREHEVILLSNYPNTDIFRLFYYVIQTYYQKLKRMCFSTGIAYPIMCSDINKDSLPTLVRIGTRGQCNSYTNDVSSLELYL
ncbi:hypothetical protein L9F63_022784, partial [Diploptera punctata]